MPKSNPPVSGFHHFDLTPQTLKALDDVGYESPTPIQSEIIPHMLAGSDVVGQAQTGTGKTAAFALPLLSKLDIKNTKPQAMVLTPTRELAIQVAEAFQHYAVHIKNFHVLPIYGGQDYNTQLRQLKRGVHIVVGTPGRVMDHMRRKSLDLSSLECLVLDEADEMLRMGFIDDVEWILDQTPEERQVALFSATMPTAITRIAKRYLKNAVEIKIKEKTATAKTIRQRYWMVSGLHKLDALTRILEAEPFDGIIIFVRTKIETVELSEKLEARGYASTALNGDLKQSQRERTVEAFKKGKLDILVATDVAARGLDVERVSHVINYDMPHDTESYVHRIGRTGRAGRSGEAIIFVTPRERHMLRTIERATNQSISLMEMPTTESINDKRIARFKERISDTLAVEQLGLYYQIVEQYRQEHNIPAIELAAALARMAQGDVPLLLENKRIDTPAPKERDRGPDRKKSERSKSDRKPSDRKPSDRSRASDESMESYRIEVGAVDNVQKKNIVGAIANEGGIDSKYIGKIKINEDHSIVDLTENLPREVINALKRVYVAGKAINISKLTDGKPSSSSGTAKKATRRKAPGSASKSRNKTFRNNTNS
jgi:ATP-dependent RNA helicase DeaD